jgi:ribosomal protein S18 acetylase RimI-like enzyme
MAGGSSGGCPVNQTVVVRPGAEKDLRAVGLLWNKLNDFHISIGMHFKSDESSVDAWIASFSRTLGRFSNLWVAERDNEICGFLLARLKKTPTYLGGALVGEISDLYVNEQLRGEGTGRQLVAEAMQYFSSQNVHSIEVQIMAQNKSGLAFWNSLGFEDDIILVRQMITTGKHDA